MLDEQQRDILGEIVNLYIGQAASLLSDMTGQEIRLNVPRVLLITGDSIVVDPAVTEDIWTQGHVVSSSIRFSHGLQGKTFLMFPASQAKALVSACLGEMDLNTSISGSRNLLDTDFDVLKEVANVILNSIMGGFSELLGCCLEYSVPEIEMLFAPDNEQRQFLASQQNILLLKTELFLDAASVQGFILIAFSMNSISLLLEKINAMTEDFADYAG